MERTKRKPKRINCYWVATEQGDPYNGPQWAYGPYMRYLDLLNDHEMMRRSANGYKVYHFDENGLMRLFATCTNKKYNRVKNHGKNEKTN